MRVYEFLRLSDGARVEALFEREEAPELGTVVDLPEHGPCERLLSIPQTECKDWSDITVLQHGPDLARHAPRRDEQGFAVLQSRKEVRGYEKALAAHGHEWTYDR